MLKVEIHEALQFFYRKKPFIFPGKKLPHFQMRLFYFLNSFGILKANFHFNFDRWLLVAPTVNYIFTATKTWH